MVWDQAELEGLGIKKVWFPVLMSMTMDKKECKIVDGNPVRWAYTKFNIEKTKLFTGYNALQSA